METFTSATIRRTVLNDLEFEKNVLSVQHFFKEIKIPFNQTVRLIIRIPHN